MFGTSSTRRAHVLARVARADRFRPRSYHRATVDPGSPADDESAPSAPRAALLALAMRRPARAHRRCAIFQLPARSAPHDVAPAPDGTVWYTAQRSGHLGRLDPKTGKVEEIPLGRGSSPHGVIVGPDGAAWVTDSGQNADRPRRSGHPGGQGVPAAEGHAVHQPEHGRLRRQWRAVVDRPVGLLRQRQSEDRRGARGGCAAGPRPVRHHGDAEGRHLLRLARRQSPGAHRHAHRVPPR